MIKRSPYQKPKPVGKPQQVSTDTKPPPYPCPGCGSVDSYKWQQQAATIEYWGCTNCDAAPRLEGTVENGDDFEALFTHWDQEYAEARVVWEGANELVSSAAADDRHLTLKELRQTTVAARRWQRAEKMMDVLYHVRAIKEAVTEGIVMVHAPELGLLGNWYWGDYLQLPVSSVQT